MDETEIDLRSILGVLRRQFRLIAVTVVAFLAIAGVALFALTPIYSATALVLFDPSNKNLLDPDMQTGSAASDNARIDSEVELMRSDNLLLQVIADEKLTSDPEFGPTIGVRNQLLSFLRLAPPTEISGEEALNQTLGKLRNAVSVQRRGLTYLIAVQARSTAPHRAAEIANALARAYIADQLGGKVKSVLNSRDILDARILEARNAIVQSEGAFDSFIQTNLDQIVADTGRTDLASTQARIRELEQARAGNATLVVSLENDLAENDWAALVASLQSDALAELERQRAELDAQLEQTADPGVAGSFREQLAEIDDRLRRTAETEVNALRTALSTDQERQDELRQDLRRQVLSSSLSADMLTRLYELQQTADLARNQYQTLLARSQDLDTQASLQVADSRFVSEALPPSRPSFPNNNLILILAGLAGLGVGIGLAFLYENLIGGFMSQEQLESVLKVRTAAVIPREKPKTENESLANMLVTNPLSVFSEAVRRLRASTDLALRRDGENKDRVVIMITSTAPNEGKTTTALALARSYALAGRNTILIDCDLRKPSVHRQLGIGPSFGLLDLLNQADGEFNVASIITGDQLTDLTIIPGARRSDIPTDQVLAGARFRHLIAAASKAYEVVILDTPPMGPVVDALYIAPYADAVLFVTRWGSTAQRDVKAAINGLLDVTSPGAAILGVLNQQNDTRASYQRKYGGYYAATT